MDISDIFKGLIWDTLVAIAVKQLFVLIPFLGWGPIGLFVGFIVNKIASLLFNALKEIIDFNVIVIRKQNLAKEFSIQAYNLKMLADTKGINSDEFKAQREKSKVALSEFIKFGG